MKAKLTALMLSVLLLMPCVLRAEEIEITLMEVIQMNPLPGDDPTELTKLLQNNPEYLYTLQSTSIVYGAIAHLPIYLIRQTKGEIPERKLEDIHFPK